MQFREDHAVEMWDCVSCHEGSLLVLKIVVHLNNSFRKVDRNACGEYVNRKLKTSTLEVLCITRFSNYLASRYWLQRITTLNQFWTIISVPYPLATTTVPSLPLLLAHPFPLTLPSEKKLRLAPGPGLLSYQISLRSHGPIHHCHFLVDNTNNTNL